MYILADDMGVGDVRSYTANSPVNTPNIDRIANAGMRFTDAHSLDSVCTPSRYGILTGQYALADEFTSWRARTASLRRLIPTTGRLTVAEMLKSSGYSTGMFGKWHEGVNWATYQRDELPRSMARTSIFRSRSPVVRSIMGLIRSLVLPAALTKGLCFSDNKTVDYDLYAGSPTGQVYGNPSNTISIMLGPIAPGYDIHDTLPTIVSQATSYIGTRRTKRIHFLLTFR